MIQKIKQFIQEDYEFINTSKASITIQNDHLLGRGCIIYSLVLVFYTILSFTASQPVSIRYMYIFFDIVHAGLCIYVFTRSKAMRKSFKVTQISCCMFEVSLLTFFSLEGVYTSRTEHSLYIPIALLLVILLYVHGVVYTSILITMYITTFVLLVYLYKTPDAFSNDFMIALATLISGTIGYILIAILRHNESAALKKYEILSRTDELTGLMNKAMMQMVSRRVMAEEHHPCAFIILDLDNFKSINDNFGHDIGDKVLKKVGNAIRESFHESDYIARFGGDEFIMLMDNCTEANSAKTRVTMVITQISKLRFEQPSLRVRCSVGIAMRQVDDNDQTIFRRADAALYEAKRNKKGGYVLLDSDWGDILE